MGEDMNPSEGEITPEAVEKAKKRWPLNALILAGVFLLGAVLPPDYKVFAPVLFVIPFIINLTDKMRHAGEEPEHPSIGQTYSPPVPGPMTSHEPYSYTPKDPNDPRKYKPIG